MQDEREDISQPKDASDVTLYYSREDRVNAQSVEITAIKERDEDHTCTGEGNIYATIEEHKANGGDFACSGRISERADDRKDINPEGKSVDGTTEKECERDGGKSEKDTTMNLVDKHESTKSEDYVSVHERVTTHSGRQPIEETTVNNYSGGEPMEDTIVDARKGAGENFEKDGREGSSTNPGGESEKGEGNHSHNADKYSQSSSGQHVVLSAWM